MIRTLRITSIVAGLLAAALLVLFSMQGVRPDPEVERLLASPGVIEQFRHRPAAKGSPDTVSALEGLAEGFSRMLNPPAAVVPSQRVSRPDGLSTVAPRPRPSARFKLLATSCHPSDPNLSRALIELDTVDQRRIWVRIGQVIEHYRIVGIGDGSITYGEGNNVQVVQVEPRPPKIDLLAGPEARPRRSATNSTAVAAAVGGTAPAGPIQPARSAVVRPINPNLPTGIRPQSPTDVQRTEQMLQKLRSIQSEDPQQQQIQREVLEKLSTYLEAARQAQDEANTVAAPDLQVRPDDQAVFADANQIQ